MYVCIENCYNLTYVCSTFHPRLLISERIFCVVEFFLLRDEVGGVSLDSNDVVSAGLVVLLSVGSRNSDIISKLHIIMKKNYWK